MKRIAAISLLALLAGCVDHEGARRVLEDQGLTVLGTSKASFWNDGCGTSESDYATNFQALGPTGRPVTGVVCRGWSSGSSVVHYF